MSNITDKINSFLSGNRNSISVVNDDSSDDYGRELVRKTNSVYQKKNPNPFLKADGSLAYPALPKSVYQSMIDNSKNDIVKGYLMEASGLSPTPIQNSNEPIELTAESEEPMGGAIGVNVQSQDGVFKNTELLGHIARASKETGVPVNVLLAVAQQESAGKWYDAVPDGTAYSHGYMMLYDNGALAGLSPEMKQKAKTDHYTNVLVGARLLADHYKRYGNWQTAAARYNGSGAMAEKYGKKVIDRANSAVYKEAANQISSKGSLRLNFGSAKGSSKQNQVVETAKKYLGTPYVWGGTSPKGFDCSGLMQYVYKQMGINIPRVSQEQFKGGKAVASNDLRPGDLVFFKGSKGSTSAPGHVGMYIGNGQFLQAPKTGDVVKISNLSSRKDFVGARRYIN